MARSGLYLLVLLAVLAAAIAQDMYSDKFDHMNVDDVLGNEELRLQYYNCLMDTGPCATDDQQFLKQHAAEAFVTKCKKCTDAQKNNMDKIVVWYTENRPQEWAALIEKMIADAKKLNITPEM